MALFISFLAAPRSLSILTQGKFLGQVWGWGREYEKKKAHARKYGYGDLVSLRGGCGRENFSLDLVTHWPGLKFNQVLLLKQGVITGDKRLILYLFALLYRE